MPRFRVTLSEEAEQNVAAIYEWIAERSVEGATRWYAALNDKLGELGRDADRFPVAPENEDFNEVIRNATFRTRAGRTYRIVFTLEQADVCVLFVRGPGQDWVTP